MAAAKKRFRKQVQQTLDIDEEDFTVRLHYSDGNAPGDNGTRRLMATVTSGKLMTHVTEEASNQSRQVYRDMVGKLTAQEGLNEEVVT